MTKLASENGTNKANAQGVSAKDAGVAGAAAASVKAQAVPAPVKAAVPGKGVAPAMKKVLPEQADDAANAVKKHHEDDQAGAVQASEGEAQPLAMVDSASAASVGAIAQVDGGQDGSAGSESSDGGDGGVSAPVIIGGVLLVGGGAALALGGGGKKNVAPAFTSGTTATIAENAAVTTTVYTAAATDGNNDTLTYSLGGTDAALFNIDSKTGVVTLKASADFEAKPSYAITVSVSDGKLTTTQNVAVTVTNVNETPTITSGSTASVDENAATTTVVYDANATDPDANTTITYSLTGADAAAFNIDSKTGEVTLKASANFEVKPTYTFTVVASDGANPALTASKDVTLTVNDKNEAPTFAGSTATASVAENAATTTVVFDADATDPDAGDVITYSLSGADAAAFSIDATNGKVTLNASADFEAKSVYNFNVVATDKAGLTGSQAVTLNVTDKNEAPTITSGETGTVVENVTGATVYQTVVTDPDAGSTFTYTLSGADAGLFSVDADGKVTLTGSANYEADQSYSFTVTATDNGNPALSDTQDVTISVTNALDLLSLDQGSFGNAVTINAAGNPLVDTLADVNYQFNETPGESEVVITNFSANDFISFGGVDAGDYNYQASGNDLVITYLPNGGDLSSITLVGVLDNGAVVNSEATAEAALASKLGATTNVGGYLVGTAPPLAISVDTDGTDTYNAAGASVTFTDNGDVESNTVIQNFRSDDTIVLTKVENQGDVLYSNGLIDSNDLQIEYFDSNGQRSTIILDDAATGFLVSDFASASAALGGRTDFITFA